MVAAGIALVVMLTLLPSAPVHGDHDDDDGHPCPSAAPCDCTQVARASASTAAATATLTTSYGCAEEYLGEISGVHWYDVWKICRATCYGAVIEGEPFDNNSYAICTLGNACSQCMDNFNRAIDVPLQPRLAARDARFTKNPNGPDPNNLTAADYGLARIEGTDIYFKILTVTTEYRRETVKVRRIGIELDEATLTAVDTVWVAHWSENDPAHGTPSTGSTVHHYIDVTVPGIPDERFHVTTVTEVEHEHQ